MLPLSKGGSLHRKTCSAASAHPLQILYERTAASQEAVLQMLTEEMSK